MCQGRLRRVRVRLLRRRRRRRRLRRRRRRGQQRPVGLLPRSPPFPAPASSSSSLLPVPRSASGESALGHPAAPDAPGLRVRLLLRLRRLLPGRGGAATAAAAAAAAAVFSEARKGPPPFAPVAAAATGASGEAEAAASGRRRGHQAPHALDGAVQPEDPARRDGGDDGGDELPGGTQEHPGDPETGEPCDPPTPAKDTAQ